MKSKTLALITASIITAAALILTVGLSLLNSSAVGEESVPTESMAESAIDITISVDPEEGKQPESDEGPFPDEDIYVDGNIPVYDEPITDEPAVDEPEADLPIVDEPIIDEEIFVPEIGPLGNPVFPATEEWDGGELINGHSAPCYIDDVVIAIYEHATGKLVGQVTIRDDEAWETVNQLHLDIYSKGNCIYDPKDIEAVPVAIPNGKYRIEVYGIWYADDGGCGSLFFAYTYGNNEMIEMWKHGILYSGCEDFIQYTDSLIADEMAAIEAGTNTVPKPEEAITYICGFSGEKVNLNSFKWNGDYHKVHEAGRGTPRFPYLETNE